MSTAVDWCIGTPEERLASAGNLPGAWSISNPFLNWYKINNQGELNWHTGVDLNLNSPTWNADHHKPIYALASGTIVYAGSGSGSWGTIIVGDGIDPLTGAPFCWRVGHVENPLVETGDPVVVGQPVAQVGDASGFYAPAGAHVHLDICLTNLLRDKPNHWPGANKQQLLLNYTNPVTFIYSRYAMSANINFASHFRELLLSKPADTEVTIYFSIPPLREPVSLHQALRMTIGDILGEVAELPDTTQPVDTETWYVDKPARGRDAPAGAQIFVNGKGLVLPENLAVTASKTTTPAMLNGTLYNWRQIYAPVACWVAGEYLKKV